METVREIRICQWVTEVGLMVDFELSSSSNLHYTCEDDVLLVPSKERFQFSAA